MTISPNETYFFLHRQRGQLSTSRTQQRRRPRLTMATTRGLAVTNPLLHYLLSTSPFRETGARLFVRHPYQLMMYGRGGGAFIKCCLSTPFF